MRFSKLRLTGFKSFVDPTDLVIADGLTGVVGPNGCGKSNLLEALRWVMGETRAKAMRGDGMEDVIFAGSASRPARNFAEVVIHLDNADRLAPAGFNDADQIDITRRITRDAGSAYKVAGKEVRARDVQMLFADASTGAHSPSLVRQGQIAELINARPKARRRVLEEAAGISGLYQRRHEAELKLRGAESNLTRVDDVIDQLAQQLAQLAKQAKQAARYRQIGEELRRAEGLLLWRRWKEADQAQEAAETALRECTSEASRAEAAARAASEARSEAEEALPACREEDAIAAAILQRLGVQRDTIAEQESAARERIATLEARIDQLARDMEREAGLNRDAGESIARLDQEAADLAEADDGHDARLAASVEAAQAAARSLEAREADLGRMTEDTARLSARHQSAQRLIDDTRKTLQRSEAEAERSRSAQAEAQEAVQEAESRQAEARAAEAAASAEAEAAEATLVAADAARAAAQTSEAEARAARSEAESEAGALKAEAAALSRVVARDTCQAEQIIDRIAVTPGHEKALGAALTEELRAAEVEAGGASGWVLLPGYAAPQPLPDGVTPLGAHVTGPDALARRMAQIGVVDADAAPRLQPHLQPGQRLVSRAGDLWRWDGFHARAEDAPSAAALRLEQRNRLAELEQQLAQATARADEAARAHEARRAELDSSSEADRAAREARRAADTAVTEATRRLNRAEGDRSLAESRLESLGLAVTRHEDEARAARSALSEAEAGRAELGDLDMARADLESLKTAVEAARGEMMARRAAAEDLRREGERRAARREAIAREVSGWRHRLETAETRAAELQERKVASEAELAEARAAPDALAARRADLAVEITSAEARRSAAADALAAAEARARAAADAEREAERHASEAREARARAEARRDGARDTVEHAAGRIMEALGLTPEALLDTLGADPDAMPDSERIEADVVRLKRQRDALGAVNLRAEEDAREVEAEHDSLAAEKADLEAAISTLRSGIAGLNREGRERLLAAFERVNTNFGTLFRHLFGGGEARLVLVESDDPLEAGLEIMCQPPGKTLSTLSLLSGGEQTLTALALIFAVFLANPAPICVLDEVDAPLDDANVTRFCDLLDEMCRRTETRFLIITHHAVTMSRMDRLFGVTMAEQGVSQLVSVDLRKAEAMVA